jgi:hypothetical protein
MRQSYSPDDCNLELIPYHSVSAFELTVWMPWQYESEDYKLSYPHSKLEVEQLVEITVSLELQRPQETATAIAISPPTNTKAPIPATR